MERSEPKHLRQSPGHGRRRPDRRVRRGFGICRQSDAKDKRQQTDRTNQLQGRDQRRDNYDGEELRRASSYLLAPVSLAGLAGPKVPRSRRDKVIRNIAVGRRIKRSATNAATIAKALSQPNRRSDGRSENTVTTRPQARTTVVRISAGPTNTVARSTATSELTPGVDSSRRRLRK